MADLRQFDVQGALDAGYSGAEIQLHLMHKLGYPPAEAKRAVLSPPPNQQSRFGDMLSGVGNFISSLNPCFIGGFPARTVSKCCASGLRQF
jgi:hypothetical protein